MIIQKASWKKKENSHYYKDPNSPDFKGKKENPNHQTFMINFQ
jgi:hypothetical protein